VDKIVPGKERPRRPSLSQTRQREKKREQLPLALALGREGEKRRDKMFLSLSKREKEGNPIDAAPEPIWVICDDQGGKETGRGGLPSVFLVAEKG